jgi:hypothetical protein
MATERTCPVCSCTELDPCRVHGVPCAWLHSEGEGDLCTACAAIEDLVESDAGLLWLDLLLGHVEGAGAELTGYEPCRERRARMKDEGGRTSQRRTTTAAIQPSSF